jgi:hypothetical protein
MAESQSWNFVTQQYEVAPPGSQMTVDQAVQYVPEMARGLLRVHVGNGETVAAALLKTLETVCGIKTAR